MALGITGMYVPGVRLGGARWSARSAAVLRHRDPGEPAAERDEQPGVRRNRPNGEITRLILDARYEKFRPDEPIVTCALLRASGIGRDGT